VWHLLGVFASTHLIHKDSLGVTYILFSFTLNT
jgi:hypothetical protein